MRTKTLKRGVFIALGALAVWGLGFFIQSWAMLDTDKIRVLPQSSVIYDDENKAVETISGVQNRTSVKLEDIPDHVVNAFLAAEDARFYSHHGIDVYRVGGAVVSNIKSGGFSQGASTITQQLIKLTHLSSDKTIERKLREAVLAVRLETEMSKDDILGAYLNTVYFGSGAYGIDAAARRYLGVEAGELTLSQGAMLAGVIKSPSNYAPNVNYEKAKSRRNMILDAMAEYGYITREEAARAKAADENIMPAKTEQSYGWYVERAAEEAADILKISYDELLIGGYGLYTAMNAQLQNSARELFDESENFPPRQDQEGSAQAALVAVEAKTGEIKALIGGTNREVARGLNRACDIKRQPGSAFKPISVYAAAVDRYGFLPSSFVDDTKREFEGGYSPSNVSGNYYGEVTLREALSRSLNVASVDLISRIGVDSAKRYAQRAGIELSDDDMNLSLALGSVTHGVSPLELACAYAPLANAGINATGHTVRRITDREGKTLYEYRGKSERIMSAESARLVTDMLITAAASGTAKALAQLPFQVAGKTGTVGERTVGNRDVWNVAYTPKMICCVWMGYDEADARHCLPNTVTGSNYPTRLAAKFMTLNAGEFDGGEFITPKSLVRVPIDLKALREGHEVMLAGEYTPKSYTVNELFTRSAVPRAVSDVWVAPSKVFDLYVARLNKSTVEIYFTAVDSDAVYLIYRVDADGDELIAERSADASQRVSLEYRNSDSQTGYRVVGVDKTLYAEGVYLAGESSPICREAATLQWDIRAEDSRSEVVEQRPLFGG